METCVPMQVSTVLLRISKGTSCGSQEFQQQKHTKLNTVLLSIKFIGLEDSKRSEDEAQI